MKQNDQLQQRAKELTCLYDIDAIFKTPDIDFQQKIKRLIAILPTGFKKPESCSVQLIIDDDIFKSNKFKRSQCLLAKDIFLDEDIIGSLTIFYTECPKDDSNDDIFSYAERKLINTIADWIGRDVLIHQYEELYNNSKGKNKQNNGKSEWEFILDMQKKTDQTIYSVLARKMLNQMLCGGIKGAEELFTNLGSTVDPTSKASTEINSPTSKQVLQSSYNLASEIYDLAQQYYSDDELIELIRRWIYEEKMKGLVKSLANRNSSLAEIADALQHYNQLNPDWSPKGSKVGRGIVVGLINKFFTDQLSFIDIAKNFIDIDDFFHLAKTMIYSSSSSGKLGGKSAGLFIAHKIIEKSSAYSEIFANIKIPKTWYLTSDCILSFLYYNNLDDMNEQKYKNIEDIAQEYPHIIQTFKNAHFPPFIINGLSRALDNFGDKPLIVRSSSLLEDRLGTAFAGKYKSLFLANQGSKEDRLEKLLDAIAEVYASMISPDAIEYRKEKGLLDYNEQMGILLQEVVGEKVGNYYFPAFAGVAFSNNEFRWSPRIKREDGLIRMVPGLGTRAVDRIGNDFPILITPGQPQLRVNITYKDLVRYSPQKIDVIDLKHNSFVTISYQELIKNVGNKYPLLNEIFSIDEDDNLKTPIGLGINTKKHDIVPTFENLIRNTNFVKKTEAILNELKAKLGYPIDLEFACDSKNIFLLQCRPQSESMGAASAIIPADIDPNKVIFSANKFVSNGKVPNISYIVYVDSEKYEQMAEYNDMLDIGRAVGKLNKLLPRRSFILMGPGRWGTRDDVKLGVKITYSDINNTSMLIEIAKQKGGYVPDLSFGTHFFQDLVEAEIRYLPLYPDKDNNIFNNDFFADSKNSLLNYLPEFEHIADVLKLVDVSENTEGQILRVLMNADEDKALAYLTNPGSNIVYHETAETGRVESPYDDPLQWRKRMAESIALNIDPEKSGVKGVFLYGSVFNGRAGGNSDIDIIVHFEGSPRKKEKLEVWLDAWNMCLSKINYDKSGYLLKTILDIQIIEDSEFEDRKYIADLISNTNHNSLKLKMNRTTYEN